MVHLRTSKRANFLWGRSNKQAVEREREEEEEEEEDEEEVEREGKTRQVVFVFLVLLLLSDGWRLVQRVEFVSCMFSLLLACVVLKTAFTQTLHCSHH